MKKKLNCWEFKNCCKEKDSNGSNNDICPVKREMSAHGLNGGINGGRICWVVMETHGFKKALTDCFQCEFHYKVMLEEGLLNNCNAIGTYLVHVNSYNSLSTHNQNVHEMS